MKKRLTALLTTAALFTSALPFVIASADDTETYEKVIYYEGFDEEDKELTVNTDYIARDYSINTPTFKIVDGALEYQTSGKATGMVVNSRTGLTIYPKTNDSEKYSVDYINTNDGTVFYEFKLKTTGITINEHFNMFAKIIGYNLSSTGTAVNLGGMCITNGTYSTSWTNTTNSIKRNLIESDEWVTHRITIDKGRGIYAYYIYNEDGEQLGGYTLTNQTIPDVVNALDFKAYKNNKVNATYPNDYNTIMYFDDFKVTQFVSNKVASTSPSDKAENVLLDTKPAVTFKYPVAEADLTKDNFKVEKNGSAVSEDDYSLSLDENDSKNVIIDFADSLEEGAEYKITVNNVSADGAENTAMSKAYSYSFKAIKYFEIAEPTFSKTGENEVLVNSDITANDVKVGDKYVVIAQIIKRDENGKMYIYDNSVQCGSFKMVNNTLNFEANLKYTEGSSVKLMLWTGFENGKSYLDGTETVIPSL